MPVWSAVLPDGIQQHRQALLSKPTSRQTSGYMNIPPEVLMTVKLKSSEAKCEISASTWVPEMIKITNRSGFDKLSFHPFCLISAKYNREGYHDLA
jgi:hypothetical protein